MNKEKHINEILDMFPKWEALREDIKEILEKTWEAALLEASKDYIEVTAHMKITPEMMPMFGNDMNVIKHKLLEVLPNVAFTENSTITVSEPDPVTGDIMVDGKIMVVRKEK